MVNEEKQHTKKVFLQLGGTLVQSAAIHCQHLPGLDVVCILEDQLGFVACWQGSKDPSASVGARTVAEYVAIQRTSQA